LICSETIDLPTFYRQARFLLKLQILPKQLPHLPHVATALPVNSVIITTPAKKGMYHPWNLWGLNLSFFMIWEA